MIMTLAAIAFLASCSSGGNNPGQEYAPNMYVSEAYEPYSQLANKPNTINKNGLNMREPARGTIARGQLDYANYNVEVNPAEYEKSSLLINPIEPTIENLAEGRRLFKIYCSHCHGAEGKGDGSIVTADKFPPPPSYESERIKLTPEGKMFYSIKNGKNLMGPHGRILSPNQIWLIVKHVKKLSGTLSENNTQATIK